MPDPVTPQPMPINAKFEGDFVTQLVVVLRMCCDLFLVKGDFIVLKT